MELNIPVILYIAVFMTLGNLLVFRGLRVSTPPADAPLVSILVPARNEARNIEACVSSLLAQDYPNWELIVLDDNSDDATGDLARRLTEREGRKMRTIVVSGTRVGRAFCFIRLE